HAQIVGRIGMVRTDRHGAFEFLSSWLKFLIPQIRSRQLVMLLKGVRKQLNHLPKTFCCCCIFSFLKFQNSKRQITIAQLWICLDRELELGLSFLEILCLESPLSLCHMLASSCTTHGLLGKANDG